MSSLEQPWHYKYVGFCTCTHKHIPISDTQNRNQAMASSTDINTLPGVHMGTYKSWPRWDFMSRCKYWYWYSLSFSAVVNITGITIYGHFSMPWMNIGIVNPSKGFRHTPHIWGRPIIHSIEDMSPLEQSWPHKYAWFCTCMHTHCNFTLYLKHK